ncbi:Oidioi.mRNA.OKI2018_I69.XSR.g15357.t1.cds [Oikopleura dioica]|uniref:Oidioi.mRNA.OKI2018_I69.XSR.g15357.t1.cds n=1 Tax=Oikopleura dioica TaxID=34765 RepID=A0ABN7SLT4_OIKDI|nr:Oidioi.mRNA.OKI2018_I69.XSR.g15357.t1.cds [Oikopleura dioica]
MPEKQKRTNQLVKSRSYELPIFRDSPSRPFLRSTTVSSFDSRLNSEFKEPRRRPSVKKITSAAILKLKELRFRSKTQKNAMFPEKRVNNSALCALTGAPRDIVLVRLFLLSLFNLLPSSANKLIMPKRLPKQLLHTTEPQLFDGPASRTRKRTRQQTEASVPVTKKAKLTGLAAIKQQPPTQNPNGPTRIEVSPRVPALFPSPVIERVWQGESVKRRPGRQRKAIPPSPLLVKTERDDTPKRPRARPRKTHLVSPLVPKIEPKELNIEHLSEPEDDEYEEEMITTECTILPPELRGNTVILIKEETVVSFKIFPFVKVDDDL